MEILARPNSPYGNYNDRSFKTVTAALRFIIRSYFNEAGVARHVAVYEGDEMKVHIGFEGQDALVLTEGSVKGWNKGEVKTLDEALTLTQKLHRA